MKYWKITKKKKIINKSKNLDTIIKIFDKLCKEKEEIDLISPEGKFVGFYRKQL